MAILPRHKVGTLSSRSPSPEERAKCRPRALPARHAVFLRRWIEEMSHASLFRRAVLYELIALVLIFLVTIAWYGHRRDPLGLHGPAVSDLDGVLLRVPLDSRRRVLDTSRN